MKNSSITRGLMIVFVISILITMPRILNFDHIEVWSLLLHFLYIFLLNIIYLFLANSIVRQNWDFVKVSLVYLPLTGIISVVYNFLVAHFFFRFKLLSREFPLFRELIGQNENIILFVRGLLFSGIIYFVIFYLTLLLEKQKSSLEIEQLKKEKLEAQLASLKQQVSPHFLFNSLSTLRTMVDDSYAKEFINKLAEVYRYLLNLNESDLVLVKEEISFTNSYLYILKERFEEALQVEVLLPTAINSKKIPPLVIQLLVENAIKHNEVSIKNPLTITIEMADENHLVIRNNIQPKITAEISTGKGLDNISYRYQILANREIVIEKSEEKFSVKIPLL